MSGEGGALTGRDVLEARLACQDLAQRPTRDLPPEERIRLFKLIERVEAAWDPILRAGRAAKEEGGETDAVLDARVELDPLPTLDRDTFIAAMGPSFVEVRALDRVGVFRRKEEP